MKKYDYYDSVKQDVINYINENLEYIEDDVDISDKEELYSYLYDALFSEDSVTGNRSGSYTCNSEKAKEYVLDNMKLLNDAVYDFDIDNISIGRMFLNEEWETFDIYIRLCVLGGCIIDAIEELDF